MGLDDKKPASADRDWRDEVADNHEFWLLEDSGGQVRVIYDPPPSFFNMPTIHVVRQSALAEAEAVAETWKLKFQRECDLNTALQEKLAAAERAASAWKRKSEVLREAVPFPLDEKTIKLIEERDGALAEVAELKNNLPLESAWSRLKDAQARIAELELLAHVTDESSFRAKAKRLIEERDAALAERDALLESIKDKGQAELRLKASERDAVIAEVERLRGDRDKFLASDDCYYWTPESQAERDRYKSALKDVRHSLSKLQNGSMFTPESELKLAIKYVDEALTGGE